MGAWPLRLVEAALDCLVLAAARAGVSTMAKSLSLSAELVRRKRFETVRLKLLAEPRADRRDWGVCGGGSVARGAGSLGTGVQGTEAGSFLGVTGGGFGRCRGTL